MADNNYISELRGYLKLIERLCGAKYSFGVINYSSKGGVDRALHEFNSNLNKGLKYDGYSLIEYEELILKIETMIFNGFLNRNKIQNEKVRSYMSGIIIEDINEYYGLASTSTDKNNIFHPLIEGPVYQISVFNPRSAEAIYYLVKISDSYVLTYLCKYK